MVIVDDEPPARAKLRRFMSELEDFHVVAEADAVETAVTVVSELTPDVLYLDIQLGTRSGFEVLDALHAIVAPVIVFTTAYSEHAVRAFEVHALDCLLKPFDRGRFVQSAARVRATLVAPDRSDWEREPLSSFISQLAPEEFLRVHRSHVVRIGLVEEMHSMFHGGYELRAHFRSSARPLRSIPSHRWSHTRHGRSEAAAASIRAPRGAQLSRLRATGNSGASRMAYSRSAQPVQRAALSYLCIPSPALERIAESNHRRSLCEMCDERKPLPAWQTIRGTGPGLYLASMARLIGPRAEHRSEAASVSEPDLAARKVAHQASAYSTPAGTGDVVCSGRRYS